MYDSNFHDTIKGSDLDGYLSRGWFRSGSMIFTVDCTIFDNQEYPVYWLRYDVNKVNLCAKSNKLVSSSSQFEIACRPLKLTNEVEQLFEKYRKGIKFKLPPELDYILEDTDNNIFESRLMTVRDNGQLIACGIFDVGTLSIGDIINFYDPAYKRYSLGKFLMVSKYQYCQKNGYEHYYPGYYLPGHKVMSYKLFLDEAATEVYLRDSDIWIAYPQFEATLIS